MTWLLSLISLPKLIAGLGALVALVAGILGIRKSGKDAALAKQAKDTLKRTDAGRQAVADAKRRADDGESPEEIARKNDGEWQ
ncbi:MAG: hypothetical protein RL268_824 [Pseudomonadota bacterium]|jgi:hypothetical protein